MIRFYLAILIYTLVFIGIITIGISLNKTRKEIDKVVKLLKEQE